MKLKQRNNVSNTLGLWPVGSKYQSTIVFQKKKNNGKFKKVKPISGARIGTLIQAKVREFAGTNKCINPEMLKETEERNNKKKIKIKWTRNFTTSNPTMGSNILTGNFGVHTGIQHIKCKRIFLTNGAKVLCRFN